MSTPSVKQRVCGCKSVSLHPFGNSEFIAALVASFWQYLQAFARFAEFCRVFIRLFLPFLLLLPLLLSFDIHRIALASYSLDSFSFIDDAIVIKSESAK